MEWCLEHYISGSAKGTEDELLLGNETPAVAVRI